MKFQDRRPVLLSDLTEAQFAEFIHGQEVWKRVQLKHGFVGGDGKQVIYRVASGVASRLTFEGGRLQWGSFFRGDEFSFAKTEEGPFHKLGLTRRELINAFGKPQKWEYRNRGGV